MRIPSRVAALVLGVLALALHLDRLQAVEELERGLPQEELVLAPQEMD